MLHCLCDLLSLLVNATLLIGGVAAGSHLPAVLADLIKCLVCAHSMKGELLYTLAVSPTPTLLFHLLIISFFLNLSLLLLSFVYVRE